MTGATAGGRRTARRGCLAGALLAATLLLRPLAAQAAEEPGSTEAWRALTRTDVAAAVQLLTDNHPGMVPAAGDPAFPAALAAARAKAFQRAETVASYEGYVATLGELANSMGDGHIWSNARFLPRTVAWAGLIAARRGPTWVVARAEAPADPALAGARLLSCDGRPIDALAHEALHFRTNVALEPALALQGGWLLIDEHNPFLPPPKACELEKDGRRTSVQLSWASIGRDALLAGHWNRPAGRAGFGVRATGQGGFWISLQHLGPEAQAVVDAARARSTELRSAPYVVIDLRGNGGGDDAYGRALAEALYGPAAVMAALGPQDTAAGGCDSVFRASPGNIEATAADAVSLRRRGDTVAADAYDAAVAAMKAALAAGRPLAGDLACRDRPRTAGSGAAPLIRGKVFLLTDVACFSSCIQTAEFFRAMGAIHVGQSTGADTHYSEVREIILPSGLATFSTLRALMPDHPHDIGPYLPVHAWDGDMADTPALEAWIAGLARQREG
jgi:hypothetical protein